MPDPLPPDLAAILDQYSAAERDAAAVLDGLSDEQATAAPGAGRWSVADCLEHLAATNRVYAGVVAQAIEAAGGVNAPRRGGPVRPGFIGRYLLGMVEPPPRKKFVAPTAVAPGGSLDPAGALERFIRSHDDLRRLAGEHAGLDWNRIRRTHPFAKWVRLSIGTYLLIVAAHDRRHVWQARQTRAAILPRTLV